MRTVSIYYIILKMFEKLLISEGGTRIQMCERQIEHVYLIIGKHNNLNLLHLKQVPTLSSSGPDISPH